MGFLCNFNMLNVLNFLSEPNISYVALSNMPIADVPIYKFGFDPDKRQVINRGR